MKKYYWFSFSFQGNNQGVCLIEAESGEKANEKRIALNISPEWDSLAVYEIDNAEIETDVFVSAETLYERGYYTRSTF